LFSQLIPRAERFVTKGVPAPSFRRSVWYICAMHICAKPAVAVALAACLLPPAADVPVNEAAMIPVEGEGAKYWPRWRGPSGQGLAVGSGYVDTWSDTSNVKWKTTLDTTGNGSPIVWANRIFLTTGSADGTKRGIAAFDRATGRKLWETYAPDTNVEATNLKNGYASSTP